MTLDPNLTGPFSKLSLSSTTPLPPKEEETESLKDLTKRKMPALLKIKEEMGSMSAEIQSEQTEAESQKLALQKETQAIFQEARALAQKQLSLEEDIDKQAKEINTILEQAKVLVVNMKKCCGDTVWIPLNENGYSGSLTTPDDLAEFVSLYAKNPDQFVTKPMYQRTGAFRLEQYMLDRHLQIPPVSKEDYFSYPLQDKRAQAEYGNRYCFWLDTKEGAVYFDNIPGINHAGKFLDFASYLEESQVTSQQLQTATLKYSDTLNSLSTLANKIEQKQERLKALRALEKTNEERLHSIRGKAADLQFKLDLLKKLKKAQGNVEACKKQNDPQALAQARAELRAVLLSIN